MALLSRLRVKHRHLLANFAFIPGELNREISASKPSEYFSKFKAENIHFDEVLETRLVSHEPGSAIWKDNYEAFAKERIESIYHEIEKVVGTISPLEVELEHSPIAVLDRLQRSPVAVRDVERFGERHLVRVNRRE